MILTAAKVFWGEIQPEMLEKTHKKGTVVNEALGIWFVSSSETTMCRWLISLVDQFDLIEEVLDH
jgi:hypothetical protein